MSVLIWLRSLLFVALGFTSGSGLLLLSRSTLRTSARFPMLCLFVYIFIGFPVQSDADYLIAQLPWSPFVLWVRAISISISRISRADFFRDRTAGHIADDNDACDEDLTLTNGRTSGMVVLGKAQDRGCFRYSGLTMVQRNAGLLPNILIM